MSKTAPPILFSKLSLAPVILIFIFLSGCKTGPGVSGITDSFGFDEPRINLPVVLPPRDPSPTQGFEYLQIQDFEGFSECAKPLKRKIRELAGELGEKGFKLGPFFPKDKTVELRGRITKCQIENTYGELEVEFFFKVRGVQRETKTISKNLTLGPGSTRDRVMKKLVSYMGREFSKKYLPRKVESLRYLCGSKSDPGIIAVQKESWDSAISHWMGRISQDQHNSCIQNNLGVAWEGKGNLQEADKFYQLAISGKNDFAPQNYPELRRYCPPDECGSPPPCPTYPDCGGHVCPIQEQDPRPRPSWVNKPTLPGYVHVVRGLSSEGKTLADLERSAETDARIKLSASIQVTVDSSFEETMENMSNRRSGASTPATATTSSETSAYIKIITKEKTDSILINVKPLEYWKDKTECAVYALMGMSQQSLEKSIGAYQKQWEQSLLSKSIMLFDVSETHSDMADLLQGKLRNLFGDLGVPVLQKDPELHSCVTEPKQKKCQGTMFGSFTVKLLEEGEVQGSRKREYEIKGDIVFGDRLVFQINQSCLGQGAVGDSNRSIDNNGIEECFDPDIAPKLLRDIQR